MRELVDQLLGASDAGGRVACCRLVETRGSTPQKPGATMLVFEDGSQAGTLGGGCVEAEVKRQALATLSGRSATVVSFQLDDDYGWDDGLICGGRMQVLIDPLAESSDRDYYALIGRLVNQGAGLTEAIVFDTDASGLPAGAAYLFDEAGELLAHVRGPLEGNSAPHAVRAGLAPLTTRPRPSASHGIAYLPLLPRCRLLIVGGGHVGQAVAGLAADLEFDVWIIDDRAEYVTDARFPKVERRISGIIGEVLPSIEVTPN
ncbi:MAG TPA: XdhC family protein, partial [Pirellulales bacterium]